jgi:MFS family permease
LSKGVTVAQEQTPDSRRWTGLTGMCTAAGLVWLAFADFGVEVPTISRDLGGSLSALQWANNALSLVTGALVLAAGRFGDIYGRRRMLEIGLVIFGRCRSPRPSPRESPG